MDSTEPRLCPVPDDGKMPSALQPPTPARLFRIAAGLDEPTAEEEAWFDVNPASFERELRLRQALERKIVGPSHDVQEELAAAATHPHHYCI